jgi:hypothetical protein
MRSLLCACVAALGASGDFAAPSRAQQSPPSASGAGSDAGQAPVHRDPFVRPTDESRTVPAPPEAAPLPPPEGLAGLSGNQITVRGLLEADGRTIALVQGPDKKHYVIRPGDRLRDGVVQAVVGGRLVVMVPHGPAPADDAGSGPPRKPLPYAGESR